MEAGMGCGVAARERKQKESFWRKHVKRQRSGGESVRGYCREHGLKEPAFYWWRRELARREAIPTRPSFVPVEVVADPVAIEISLPGVQVRLTGPVDRQVLAEALAVMTAAGIGGE
jgi:hypothetical protein